MGRTGVYRDLYKKVYGSSIPTPEKIKNIKLIETLLRDIYRIAVADGKNRNFRVAKFERLIKREYNIPGAVQDWLVDSVKSVYKKGYEEGKR